jgi:hypothetical protein
MFERLKKFFRDTELKEPEPITTKAPRKRKEPKVIKEPEVKLTEKEQATLAGEPYIAILKVDVDPNNINSGAFELDWNAKFAANLARAGYMQKPGETEDVIVDRWFQTVCRNIALEIYEQNIADPTLREADALREELRHIRSKDLGDGRSEIS